METYKLIWVPANGEAELQDVYGHPHVEEVFRFFNSMEKHNHTDWRMDGDGWHTEIDSQGGWLITRF